MADLNPYWLGQGVNYGTSSGGIRWPLDAREEGVTSNAGEVFEFTWAQDSSAPAPQAQGFSAVDRVWFDEAMLFVTGIRRNGKVNYNKLSAIRTAKSYLTSAGLTADEGLKAVREILSALNVSATVTPFSPTWKTGDVITVKFDAYGIAYTYVRGRANWPGDGVPLTDAQVDAHYLAGTAKPVLQQGGVAFDKARLVS